MRDRLIDELGIVGKRMRSATQLTVLATCWLAFFLSGWALSLSGPLLGLPPAILSLGFLGICLVFSIGFCVLSRNWFSDIRWIASKVESRFPELDSRLLTSLDQPLETSQSPTGFLQQVVFIQTLSHSSRHPWSLVVPQSKLLFAKLAAILGFVLMLLGSLMIASNDPVIRPETLRLAVTVDKGAVDKGTDPPKAVRLESIEPGNTEIEKGATLVVLANFKDELPAGAELVYEFASTGNQAGDEGLHRVAMDASFDDPIFAGQIESLSKPITYWVEFEDQSSDRFYATIFQYPELVQLDFELDYPDYTGLANKIIHDGRRISALKGTRVSITARLNKKVSSCQLVAQDHSPISFQPDSSGEPVYLAEFEITDSRRFQLKLLDQSDRANKIPPEVQVNALENKPPTIKITAPRRDVEVSPLEEFQTAASVADDYGIQRAGIAFSIAGKETTEIALTGKLGSNKNHAIDYLIDFELLQAQPDQVVSYFFWAEDLVNTGAPRRVMSDMFFAEVRDFDKIFRQGEPQNAQQRRQQQNQQNQQQSQQGQQAAQLRQLQKEIINATWKLIRREPGPGVGETFIDDVGVIQDSQHSAIELVDKAIQAINRPEAAAIGTQLKDMINQVVLTLQSAKEQETATPLVDAVAKEQMVYQLILQLGTNESQVQQQQQQQSSSSSSSSQQSRSRQQLQQLQLSNDRNRYEQENQAQLRKEQEQSEVRQALNRLKELARRQEDINKQLEQLQTSLEEAKSEEEKQEIERRLKRLREQQEELLRDLDELKEQAEQKQDSELMKKASEELDKARENVRRSAEALKEQQVSQAAAAGNRAQEQFEDLREEFRKGNANQFTDEMEQMSREASQLKDNQDQIAERLRQMDESPKKSLRENADRKKVAKELVEQGEKYDSILEDIKDVVRKAEETEPLLSQQLYDTFRDTSRSSTRDAIDTTEELLSRGFLSESRKTEKNANEGIEQLNQGIQKAAANIIGDEAESLRRAEQTLRKLSNQINSEIQENNPGPDPQGQVPSDSRSRDPQGAPPNSGNNPDGQDAKQRKTGDPADPQKAPGKSDRSTQNKSPAKKGQGEAKNQKESSKLGRPGAQQKSSGQPGKQQSGKQQSGKQQSGKGQEKAAENRQPPQGGKKGEQPGKSGQEGRAGPPSPRQNPSANDSPTPSGKQSNQETRRNSANRSPRDGLPLDGYEDLFGPANGAAPRPISGTQYRQFSNDLREIEELLNDPKLSAQAAEIREKAKAIRVDMKRHSKEPNWDVVQEFIAEPLEVLRSEVARQLLLKENKEALVPIDRDPVPSIFEAQVQEYYKELSEIEK